MKLNWQIDSIKKMSEEPCCDDISRSVYREMLRDYYQEEETYLSVSKNTFFGKVDRFDPSEYDGLENALYFGLLFSDMEIDLPNIDIPRSSLGDIMRVSTSYMRSREPNEYKVYKRVCECGHAIQMINNPNRVFLGKSYFLTSKEFYILISSVNRIQDIVTSLHECRHIENYLQYGLNLSETYSELPSIIRELYVFDYLERNENRKDVEKARIESLYRYVKRAIDLYHGVMLLKEMKCNQSSREKHESSYQIDSVDYNYLLYLLSGGINEELKYVLSFIAGLDIYNRCDRAGDANLFVTGYQIGMRDVNIKVVDRIAPYLIEQFNPYEKTKKL